MRLIRGYRHRCFLNQPIAATIGNFDGVHLGHQALIEKLQHEAAKRHLPTAVVVFEPQPAEYFRPNQAPSRIYTLREKVRQLARFGVDYVICLKFDRTLSTTKATDFSRHILFERLHVRYLLIGEDFRFGYQRQGDIETLRLHAQAYGAEVDCFCNYIFDDARVSSTRIRLALQQGNFAAAERLLGRKYAISGRVLHGDKRGRQWGIPTANIKLTHVSVPLQGVYDVWVERSNGKCYAAVANVGKRPTVDGSQHFLEVHLHHFDQSIYGERLRVVFLHKRRDEIKFSDIDGLINQINQDIQESKAFFAKHYDFDFKE